MEHFRKGIEDRLWISAGNSGSRDLSRAGDENQERGHGKSHTVQ